MKPIAIVNHIISNGYDSITETIRLSAKDMREFKYQSRFIPEILHKVLPPFTAENDYLIKNNGDWCYAYLGIPIIKVADK